MLLLLLSVRVLVAACMGTRRCIHRVHTWQYLFSISVRFIIICLLFVPRIALRTNVTSSGVFTALCRMYACHAVACHSAAPVVAAATATTHNRGIAATTAAAGTGCFVVATLILFLPVPRGCLS